MRAVAETRGDRQARRPEASIENFMVCGGGEQLRLMQRS